MIYIRDGIIWIYLFTIFILNFNTNIDYLNTFIFIVLALFYIIINLIKRSKIKLHKNNLTTNLLPLLLIIVWIYGFFRGLYLGNTRGYIIRNFAGLSVYITYYLILYFKLDLKRLKSFLYKAGIYAILLTLITYIDTQVLKTYILKNIPILNHYRSGGHNVLIMNQFLIFPIILLSLNNIRIGNRGLLNVFIFIVASFDILIANNQGGFIVGYFIYIMIFIFASGIIKIRTNKLGKILLISFIIFALIASIFAIYKMPNSFLSEIFSPDAPGNNIRLKQVSMIIKEITFWGKGLGATFDSYVRISEFPYAVEVVYLNLIHKFGVLSTIIFFSYFYIFYKAARFIVNNRNIENSLIAIGLISFIFPAISNPYLFSPYVVVSHTISFILLREYDID